MSQLKTWLNEPIMEDRASGRAKVLADLNFPCVVEQGFVSFPVAQKETLEGTQECFPGQGKFPLSIKPGHGGDVRSYRK